MKRINIFLILLVLFAAIPFIAAADDSEDSSYTDVTVTSVEYDPEVFMPGDEGTITIAVKNTGDESVTISRAELYSQDVTNLNDEAYDTVGALGAGNSMEFTFNVKTPLKEGIYYPRFYLDFYGSSGLSYNVPVKVDDTGLTISVIDSPDAWQEDVSKSIQIRVGNPSQVTADGVILYAFGDGIESDQTSYFVGALEPNEYVDVTFGITPSKETTLNLNAEWNNGMNSHKSEISVPVEFGEDTTGPDPVINNVEISDGMITGDLSNAGLEYAYSVIVTVGSPAVAIEPYKQYVIGSLEPDDFSSFELTYSLPESESSFPLITTWKDKDGNEYSSEYTVSTSSGMTSGDASKSFDEAPSGMSGGPSGGRMGMMSGGMGSGFANIPVFEIIIGLIIVIALMVAWKKGYLAKAAKVVKEKLNKGDGK